MGPPFTRHGSPARRYTYVRGRPGAYDGGPWSCSGRTAMILPRRNPTFISATKSVHAESNSGFADVTPWPERVDAVPKQQLAAVDVADARR